MEINKWVGLIGAGSRELLPWTSTNQPRTGPERDVRLQSLAALVVERAEFSRLGVVQRPDGTWGVGVLVDEGYTDRAAAEAMLVMFVNQLSSRVQSVTPAQADPTNQGG